jgi:serine/threonine-protein kinase
MSPEQLEGREVTTRSDLYSLGLLLYELFSGRRAFQGRTLAEVMRHRAEAPAPLTELVPELDPRLGAVVERCLDRDPSRRPSSALVVAASLGGDPLASALAEGHTPSPEMVAAAGEAEGRMAPAAVWTALGLTVATVALVPVLYAPVQLVDRIPMTRPAAVLEDRAREVVARLGYEPEPLDRAVGWAIDADYFAHVKGKDDSTTRWDGLAGGAPPVLQFWYRQSPRVLVSNSSTGKIYWGEPSWWVSGSIQMRLDTRGRLLSFYAIPPQVDPRPGETSPRPADFAPLFEEAGLDMARFEPVPSQWAPPLETDVRLAWEGSWPERPEIPVRIEGASYRGRPVAFYAVAPWTRPHHDVPYVQNTANRVANAASMAVFVVLVAVAAFLARRHLQTGRADRAGAAKVALAVFGLGAVGWTLAAHHLPLHTEELGIAIRGLSGVLFVAAIVWLFYLALEPFVRRLWPHALISWSRLLAAGTRDPVVARDLLVGLAAGGVIACLVVIVLRLPGWLGRPPTEPTWSNVALDGLLGLRYSLSSVAYQPLASVGVAMGSFLILALARLVLRREWLAALFYIAVFGTLQGLRWDLPLVWGLPLAWLIVAEFTWIALRFGLLAFIMLSFATDLMVGLTTTADLTSWHSEPTRVMAVVVLGLALYAFRGVRTTARSAG